MTTQRQSPVSPSELALLGELERKVLWLASWIIHNANHLRESADGLKVTTAPALEVAFTVMFGSAESVGAVLSSLIENV